MALSPLSLPSWRDRECSKVTGKEFVFPEQLRFMSLVSSERALELFPAASREPGAFVWIPCGKMLAGIPAAVMAGGLQKGQALATVCRRILCLCWG